MFKFLLTASSGACTIAFMLGLSTQYPRGPELFPSLEEQLVKEQDRVRSISLLRSRAHDQLVLLQSAEEKKQAKEAAARGEELRSLRGELDAERRRAAERDAEHQQSLDAAKATGHQELLRREQALQALQAELSGVREQLVLERARAHDADVKRREALKRHASEQQVSQRALSMATQQLSAATSASVAKRTRRATARAQIAEQLQALQAQSKELEALAAKFEGTA